MRRARGGVARPSDVRGSVERTRATDADHPVDDTSDHVDIYDLEATLEPARYAGVLIGAMADHEYLLRHRDAIARFLHVHWPPEGATVLVSTADGGAVLYIDEITTPGRLVMTTLDPMWHFGSYFMPATERFLARFFPWVGTAL